ncbi:hypothetical protein [Rhodovarius sp.]|uniref:hypothetical protein n=1 Tax=Rhodovarius sp. TaxID=2972673 RepID=UPI0034A48D62
MTQTRAEAGMAAALRHAANNLSMVVISNLELLARGVTPDTPAARQLGRAREAAERLLAMLLPYTMLNQAPALTLAAPEAVLQTLLPLLEVAAGGHGPVTLQAEPVPMVVLPRPGLDHALLAWAMAAAAESPRGTALRICLAAVEDGVALRLWPSAAAALDGLVVLAALAGGSTSLGDDMVELRLPHPVG